MAERKRIGIIYQMQKGWMGGTYYILNLISALDTLPDREKPVVIVFYSSDEDFNYVKKYTGYPYLEMGGQLKKSFFVRVLNFVCFRFFGKRLLHHPAPKIRMSLLFPVFAPDFSSNNYVTLNWIPDFQEKHYPRFFEEKEIQTRDWTVKQVIKSSMPIIFSSQNALDDFYKFYSEAKNQTVVMHFAVSLPDRDVNHDAETMVKYGAEVSPYFFCANQFWQHKNHLSLFKAVKELKDRGVHVRLYCSGNTTDYRNPDYFPMLQNYIKDNQLEDMIHILGYMERGEQLCLMAHSQAIVQPSYFEGWSTVVEDAKALHKYVVLSDLPLHREQLKENVSFFNPDDHIDLANKLDRILKTCPAMTQYDYNDNICEFGKCFMRIVNNLTKNI